MAQGIFNKYMDDSQTKGQLMGNQKVFIVHVSHPQEVSSNSMNASGSLLSSGLYECYSHSLDTLSPSVLPWMIPTDLKVSPLRPLALE